MASGSVPRRGPRQWPLTERGGFVSCRGEVLGSGIRRASFSLARVALAAISWSPSMEYLPIRFPLQFRRVAFISYRLMERTAAADHTRGLGRRFLMLYSLLASDRATCFTSSMGLATPLTIGKAG